MGGLITRFYQHESLSLDIHGGGSLVAYHYIGPNQEKRYFFSSFPLPGTPHECKFGALAQTQLCLGMPLALCELIKISKLRYKTRIFAYFIIAQTIIGR